MQRLHALRVTSVGYDALQANKFSVFSPESAHDHSEVATEQTAEGGGGWGGGRFPVPELLPRSFG